MEGKEKSDAEIEVDGSNFKLIYIYSEVNEFWAQTKALRIGKKA